MPEAHLADNLGNTRITFNTKNGIAKVIQQDDYYPFGLEILRAGPHDVKNDYLYNKKELQEDFTEYDYGARFYDPVVARWTSVDPLAEVSRRWSPYNYVENDPIRLTDPDGMMTDEEVAEVQQEEAGNAAAALALNGQPGASFNRSQQNDDNKSVTTISTTSSPDNTTAVDVSSAIDDALSFVGAISGFSFGNLDDGGKKDGGKKGGGNGKSDGDGKPSLQDMKKNPPDTYTPEFVPPKGGNRKVTLPNGTKGWVDKKGDVWVPDDHKGSHGQHWDVQDLRTGLHRRVFPIGQSTPAPASSESNQTKMSTPAKTLTVGAIIIGVFYLMFNSIVGHGSGGD